MNKQTDVLIIGGGFAGVSVYQKFKKSGLETILIDKKIILKTHLQCYEILQIPRK